MCVFSSCIFNGTPNLRFIVFLLPSLPKLWAVYVSLNVFVAWIADTNSFVYVFIFKPTQECAEPVWVGEL